MTGVPNTSHIETVCHLLQQTYAKLSDTALIDLEKIQFDDVYSNGLIEFAGKQEVLWAIVFDDHAGMGPTTIGSHLRDSVFEMAAKNAEQLEEVHHALLDVCPVLYLKGACLIIEGDFQPAPWRSMADIDFLVPRDKLEKVLSALRDLGYSDHGEKYTEALHAHYPMLNKDGFQVGVEVHTRCFRWPVNDLLDPERMWDRAEVIATSQGPVHIPHIDDRIIHLIVHAQIASNRYARREFLMRDALEFRILTSRTGADLEAVRSTFVSAGYEDHYLSFVAMADRIMQVSSLHEGLSRRHDTKWVDDAWNGLQFPESLVNFRRMDVAKSIIGNATKPSRWSAIVQAMLNGGEFRDLVRRIRKSLRR